jgi:tungstate transport system permease protein
MIDSFASSLKLLSDPAVVDITLRSVRVSGIATAIALIVGLPLAILIGLFDFRGKNFIKSLFNAFLGIPTVVLGLILYLLIAPNGLLGFLGLLYTEMGISVGQAMLILPIIVSFVSNSIESVERDIRDLALTLGASNLQASITLIRESYSGVILATIASFNRAIAELGIALMIGGNIFVRGGEYNTRVLTTAMQMYVARGEIEIAIALGAILLTVVLLISFLSNYLQKVL